MAAIDQAAPQAMAQPRLAAAVAMLIGALALHVAATISLVHAQTFLMGGLLGFALYRASFGFTGPWRHLITSGTGLGTRKTLLMLGCTAFSMIGYNALFGTPLVVHPVGWSLLIGAFLFGIGMQLAGGCGSGTAWVAGGGSARLMIAFAFFIAGSVWGSVDAPFWWGLARMGRFSMVEQFGHGGAIAATLLMLGLLAAFTLWREPQRTVPRQTAPALPPLRRAIHGPWSPYLGAAIMGVLAGLVVIVTAQPWGITFGYTLYGVKILTALGFDVTTWTGALAPAPFWAADWARSALTQPFWRNNAANMNVGLVLGAALAAALVGQWRPSLKGVPARAVLAAALGGILMGYGARISTGCNIGAMVNGIASGSLHGWAWMAAAFAGTAIGIRLRPVFRVAE